MKKRTYPPKRVTFGALLIRALCAVSVLTLAFSAVCRAYVRDSVNRQSEEQISEMESRIQRYINSVQAEEDAQFHMQEISARMATYLYYDIRIDDALAFNLGGDGFNIVSGYFPDCYAVAALVGRDNNIAASSRQVLMTSIQFAEEDDPDAGWYFCDDEALGLPEVHQLYADYNELKPKILQMQMTSAYINRETHSFIPHEGTMTSYPNIKDDDALVLISEQDDTVVKEINITVDLPGYELTELHQGVGAEYPRHVLFFFQGAERDAFEQFDDIKYEDRASHLASGGYWETENGAIYKRGVSVYVDGEPYWLCIRFAVNHHLPQVQKLIWKWTAVFGGLISVIALLWCWQKHVSNKAKYEFEDWQRTLTDHLAHDIKTPLTAISGYAENIMNGGLSEAEQQKYISSILENVSFTDSLISRTLFLNHIGEQNTPKQEEIQTENLVEDTIKKYELLLYEKQITYRIGGSAALRTDRISLETVIENLVSNAVKYTPENGSVNVTLDKKHLTIANTVTEKISTKELKRPFIRGDKARSNAGGNGLGLSIADRAAQTNGWKLSLSCTDAEFRAEVKF